MKLEEIEAMLQAATNGHNWAMAFEPDKHIVIGEDIQGGKCVVVIPNNGGYKQESQRDNARLIAAAPTIIKELVDRVRQLEYVLGRCESLADNGADDPAGPYNVLQQVVNTICAVLYAKEQDDATSQE